MPSSSNRQRWLAMAGIAIASFLGCIDFTIVNTAIPAIQAAFHADVAQVQWTITAFVVALSGCTIAAGHLADRHGRREAMFASMALFAAASLGAGLAPSLAWLVAWRAVQGIACAGLYTASAAVVADMFPEQQRGRALGLLFSINGLALGPVAGGLLVDAWGRRAIFLLNVPLIAAGFALCAGRVQGTGARAAARSAAPRLRWAQFVQPRFAVAAFATAALAFFYCLAFFLMPLYLSELRAQGSAVTGWLLLPTTAMMALVSPLAGRGCDRIGAGPVMMIGFAALLVSALMQSAFAADSGWAWVLAAFACMGLGWGCVLGPSMAAALAALPPALAGTALGMATTLHNIGGALGLAIGTTTYRLGAEGGGFLAGYRLVMLLLAAVCLCALAVLVRARKAMGLQAGGVPGNTAGRS